MFTNYEDWKIHVDNEKKWPDQYAGVYRVSNERKKTLPEFVLDCIGHDDYTLEKG